MEEINDKSKREKVRLISIDLIDDFPNHPFQVKDDEDMEKLIAFCKSKIYHADVVSISFSPLI